MVSTIDSLHSESNLCLHMATLFFMQTQFMQIYANISLIGHNIASEYI